MGGTEDREPNAAYSRWRFLFIGDSAGPNPRMVDEPSSLRLGTRLVWRRKAVYEPRASSISRAAATTGSASRSPGRSPRREIGPLAHTAALSLPSGPKTGALTLATPTSRSATLSAHPRLRTPPNSAASSPDNRSPSSAHASNTLPPEPRPSG